MSLNKGSLADTSVSDENDFELSNNFRRFHEINDNHMKLRPLLIILQNSRIKFINSFSKLQATKGPTNMIFYDENDSFGFIRIYHVQYLPL